MIKRTILVDADIVAFQIAAACQRVVRWEWGIWSQWADEVEAEKAMDYMVPPRQLNITP